MTHKDLDVWKKAVALVNDIYALFAGFPTEERYGLTNQMRRAAVSIPSNIAEGAARRSDKEFSQFLYISLGNCLELETQLIISKNLTFATQKDIAKIVDSLNTISKMLNGLIKSVKNKPIK